MNDDYVKTLVMDVTPGTTNDASFTAEVAEKLNGTQEEITKTSEIANVKRSYSYLT